MTVYMYYLSLFITYNIYLEKKNEKNGKKKETKNLFTCKTTKVFINDNSKPFSDKYADCVIDVKLIKRFIYLRWKIKKKMSIFINVINTGGLVIHNNS